MNENLAKRILINYRCPPLWNAALNFLFWMSLALTSVVVCYLFLMYVMDTAIESTNTATSETYNNVVQKYLSGIPLLGPHLYPGS